MISVFFSDFCENAHAIYYSRGSVSCNTEEDFADAPFTKCDVIEILNIALDCMCKGLLW